MPSTERALSTQSLAKKLQVCTSSYVYQAVVFGTCRFMKVRSSTDHRHSSGPTPGPSITTSTSFNLVHIEDYVNKIAPRHF